MSQPTPPQATPPQATPALGRRTFVVGGLAAGSLLALPDLASASASAAKPSYLRQNPFTLGVASGDPSSDGVVLWTRLAPTPLAEDGLGGMPNEAVPVRWQLAKDERFRHVVRQGTAIARPEHGHTVHVELSHLQDDREYWYRFRVGPYVTVTARTRTAPHPNDWGSKLEMSSVSCSQYEHGLFTAYGALAADEPDLILHLGDYQYEYTKGAYVAPGGNVRDHEGPETITLETYRQRHAQYKTDPHLQAAHAIAPWLVVFDDHEVENNWADETPEAGSQTPAGEAFLTRRAAAFKAYYENMPLRRTSIPRGIDLQLYRRIRWGKLANFHMLDTRQYRDDQGCNDGYKDCPAAIDPARSITGGEQEEWLIDGFHGSRARWDVIGQQVFFAQRDNNAGPVKVTSMDSWDGYVASRSRITQGWIDADVRNPVVLTGDVHAHWASELKSDYDDPTGPSVGTELVCSSITSGGDGSDSNPADHPFLQINPHLKFYNNLRGYVRTTISRDELRADFRCLPTVRTEGVPAFTRRSYVIEDGDRTLHQVYDKPPAAPAAAAPAAAAFAGPDGQAIIDATVAWETARP